MIPISGHVAPRPRRDAGDKRIAWLEAIDGARRDHAAGGRGFHSLRARVSAGGLVVVGPEWSRTVLYLPPSREALRLALAEQPDPPPPPPERFGDPEPGPVVPVTSGLFEDDARPLPWDAISVPVLAEGLPRELLAEANRWTEIEPLDRLALDLLLKEQNLDEHQTLGFN